MDRKKEAFIQTQKLNYQIHTANDTLVLSLKGTLGKETLQEMEGCLKEIQATELAFYLFDLRGVEHLDRKSHRFLVQLQTFIRRDRKGALRIVGLNNDIQKDLVRDGIIKMEEVAKNLKDGLLDLTRMPA